MRNPIFLPCQEALRKKNGGIALAHTAASHKKATHSGWPFC